MFLRNVTEESERHGLNYKEDDGLDRPLKVPVIVMRRLKNMKAFAVLYGVNTWLESGASVVIETARDKQVLI